MSRLDTACLALGLCALTAPGLAGPLGLPDGRVILQSHHRTYVVAEPDGRAEADRPTPGPWEAFELVENADGTISLHGHHGAYLRALPPPEADLRADAARIGPWEKFRVERVGGDRYAFRSAHGLYVAAEPDGRLVADRERRDAWETFRVGTPLPPVNGYTATIVEFEAGGRLFTYHQSGPGAWMERGEIAIALEETDRDEWSVYLYDPAREQEIALDLYRGEVKLKRRGDDEFRPQYDIASADMGLTGWTVTDVTYRGLRDASAGMFRQTGPGRWVEVVTAPQTRRFGFTEARRDDWSVILHDTSGGRGIEVAIDLHTGRIGHGPIGGDLTEHYEITESARIEAPNDPSLIQLVGSDAVMTAKELEDELARQGLVLVQTDEIGRNQCALVYPRADEEGLTSEFGLLTCSNQFGDAVKLTSYGVYGGCDASNPRRQGVGVSCRVGVMTNELTVRIPGGRTTFNTSTPSAEACASLSSERLCAAAGASVASGSFGITDDAGTGIALGGDIGVGAGLSGGYENGVVSGSISAKALVGGSITISVNPEDLGKKVMDVGQTGVILVGGAVVAASGPVIAAHGEELGPKIVDTGRPVVAAFKVAGRDVVRFGDDVGEEIDRGVGTVAQDVGDGIVNGAEDVGQVVTGFVVKLGGL